MNADNTARNTATPGSHLRALSQRTPLTRKLEQPADGPLFCYWCEELRSKCECRRCCLTGVLITEDSALYVIHDTIHVTGYAYRARDPNVVAPPQALNIHPFHGGTEGVGLAFSQLMMRYLSAVMRELHIRNKRELSEWWESDYGIRRVREGLKAMYSPLRAKQILAMVLVCAREDATPEEVAKANNQTLPWFVKKITTCQWLADKPASIPTPRYH